MVYTGLLVLIGEVCDYGSLTRYNYIVATITVQFVTPHIYASRVKQLTNPSVF